VRELKLKYFLELVSNIGAKAGQEAQALAAVHQRMQRDAAGTAGKFDALDRAITKAGTNTSTERQIGYMQRLGSAADATKRHVLDLQRAIANGIDKAPEKFAQVTGAVYGAKAILAPPLRAFSSLEAADAQLKIALMTKGGKVDSHYAAIMKEATDLGNKLPGSTKDYVGAAVALKEQGVSPSAVAPGLRASAYMSNLLKLPQVEAATTVAKLREAYQLKDEELPALADMAQRRSFAFGIKPQDIREAAKYSASTMNLLGLTGLQGAGNMMTVQGMAAQKGMDPSQFGTNFEMMLKMLAKGPLMLAEAKKGMKAEARDVLDKQGIEFDFFDKDGHLKKKDGDPMKGVIAELEKINLIKNKDGTANEKAQMEVASAIFGQEGGRPAMILTQAGVKGYEAAQKQVDNQADLQDRVNMSLGTFDAKLEALSGTIENVMATIATQTGNAIKPVMTGANSLLGPVGDFFGSHPGAGTAGLLATAAAGSYLTSRIGGSLWKALILRGAPQAAEALAPVVARGAGVVSSSTGLYSAGGSAPALVAPVAKGMSNFSKMLKYGGLMALLGAGLEGVSIMADPKADKPRDFTRLGFTTGMGVLGGAAAGAALGSVVPGIGTVLGGLAGGLAGSMGSGAIFDSMWKKRPDLLTLTAPGAVDQSLALGQATKIELGQGEIRVIVEAREGSSATATVGRQMPGITLSQGNTNPGAFKSKPEGTW
jgi:TP901 family phage tail tape measure protein